MKVLVATTATQGRRPTDQSGCIEGEIVWTPRPCARSRQSHYGDCACGRSFIGLETDGATTTAMVDDIVGYTRDEYIEAIKATGSHGPNCDCLLDVDRMIDATIAQTERLPVGAVVERHLRRLTVRVLRVT